MTYDALAQYIIVDANVEVCKIVCRAIIQHELYFLLDERKSG